MPSLLDRLENTNKATPQEGIVIKQFKPSAQYALSKVVDRMLHTGRKRTPKTWEDNYYFTLIAQNDQRTEAEQAILDTAQADLCLVSTYKDIIRTMTHLQFEEYWNILGDAERGMTSLVKKYWLGQGFQIDLKNARTAEELAKRISDQLVKDIVSFCEKYKAFRDGNEKRESAIIPIRQDKTIVRDRGLWSDRVYYGWSKVGMNKTTYLNNLLVSIYENQVIPADCPLNDYEKEQISEKLGLKTNKISKNQKDN